MFSGVEPSFFLWVFGVPLALWVLRKVRPLRYVSKRVRNG